MNFRITVVLLLVVSSCGVKAPPKATTVIPSYESQYKYKLTQGIDFKQTKEQKKKEKKKSE